MLEILYGPDWCAVSDAIMARVADDVSHGLGKRILLVPELVSHDTERNLCRIAGDSASRYAEVLSFSRLTRRIAAYTGSAMPDAMDNAGRVIAMAATTRQLHGSLKTYGAVQTKPEFISLLVDVVDEFKRCCISAEDIRSASNRSSGELAQKTAELALILEGYDAVCAQGKRDPRDVLNWVLGELADSDFAQTHTLYIDGFPDFTRQHLDVLEHFIRFCPQVVIGLNCQMEEDGLAFEKTLHTAKLLRHIASDAGVSVRLTPVSGRTDPIMAVCDRLFEGQLSPDPALTGSVRLFAAPSLHRECEAALEHIFALVRSGERYRDISLVCAQLPVYQKTLIRGLKRMGIPYYLAGTESLLDNPGVSALFLALDAVLDGFEQKAVLRYLRSVLSPLSDELCDLVENYAVVWNVNGDGWKQSWNNHPEGLSGRWTETVRQQIAMLDAARETALSPLFRLDADLRSALSVSQQLEAVAAFMTAIGYDRKLEEHAALYEQSGDGRMAQILRQIPGMLSGAMDQMEDVLGATGYDRDSFVRMFSMLLGQYDVGTIPTVLDAVHIGPVSAMRCRRQKHLIVLGCAEGAFPGYDGSAGIFSDRERDDLRRLDLPLTGGALEGIQNEYWELYSLFCGTSHSVSLYCSDAQSSFVLRRIEKMLCSGVQTLQEHAVPMSAKEAAGYLIRNDAAKRAEEFGLRKETEQLCHSLDYELGSVDKETVTELVGSKLYLSASKVDTYASCRLRYLLQYLLNLKERKTAEIDPAEFGTYVHDVLEHTCLEVMELGGFRQVSLDKTLEIAHHCSDRYVQEHFAQLDGSRIAYIIEHNLQELDFVVRSFWDEMSNSLYDPVAVEAHLDGRHLDSLHIPGKTLEGILTGYVDRVDVYRAEGRNYFRVVDYKTGSKTIDLGSVYNGIDLQMLIYLFALQDSAEELLGADPIPGGVMYFPARADYLDASEGKDAINRTKAFRRKGLYLSDDLSLEAMDQRPDKPSLDLTFYKNGNVKGHLLTAQQFKLLQKHVQNCLRQMVDGVSSGDFLADPYSRGPQKNACNYCPYGHICKREDEPFREFATLDDQTFWEWLERLVNEHGA